MSSESRHSRRYNVEAIRAKQRISTDPEFEIKLVEFLKNTCTLEEIHLEYRRFSMGRSTIDYMMRKVIVHALSKSVGCGLTVEPGFDFKHLESVEFGEGVFVGSQVYIQGRLGGNCCIGDYSWIGPQSYFDARDLSIGKYVGWGPGAKVLGSEHVGLPLNAPIITTDLQVAPVRVEDGADIGMNAVLLPGVVVGEGSIIGAGSIVTKDVPPFSVVAGVPARFIKWRT